MPETNPSESSAWDKAKRAVSELFNRNSSDSIQTTQPESDKKQMLFVLADKNNPEVYDKAKHSWSGDYNDGMDKGMAVEMGGNPTIYYLNSAQEGIHDPGVVIRTLREHVEKYGTLKELRISGHGNKSHMGKSANLNLWLFLKDLEQLQKQVGFKVSDRIVFDGCGVFGNLFKEDEQEYKDHAVRLGTELVGATTTVYGVGGGRFVQFTPDGTLTRDPLDDPAKYQNGQDAYRKLSISESRWELGGDQWAESELMKPMVDPHQKSNTDNPKRGKQGIL